MKFYERIIATVTLVCCLFSCSSDLDYDQVNDFNIQPVITTNLAYVNAKATDFILTGSEITNFSYTSNVDFLNTSFVKDDMVKTELYFRFKNTINRPFTFNITFLDGNDAPIYDINMEVPASSGTEVFLDKTEVFTQANVATLKNTTKMIFSIQMHPGPPITPSTPGRVEFSSSITAYFDVK